MYRIDDPSASTTLPTPEAAGTEGYWTEGNPATGVQATLERASWFNMVQEELCSIVAAAGISRAKTVYTQVRDAIRQLIQGATFQSISASVASNALTGTFNAPATLNFRNTALSNGTPLSSAVSNNLSLTIPSGATLGTVSGQAARLVWLVAYNGGTPALCVVNLAGGVNLDETTLITATAISAGSTAANVIYSTGAISGSPFRVVGFSDITETTAGTWATGPTTVQGIGGQALAALSSFGYGQTLQNVTGSRAVSTTYYNTTGKLIKVFIVVGGTSVANTYLGANVGSVPNYIFGNGAATAGAQTSIQFDVPPGQGYSVGWGAGSGALATWIELR